jgi:hypothetical protein
MSFRLQHHEALECKRGLSYLSSLYASFIDHEVLLISSGRTCKFLFLLIFWSSSKGSVKVGAWLPESTTLLDRGVDRELDERLLSFRSLSEFTRCMRFTTFVSRVSRRRRIDAWVCARATLVISPRMVVGSNSVDHGVRYIGVFMRDGVVLKSSLLPFTENDPSSSFGRNLWRYRHRYPSNHPRHRVADKSSSIITAFFDEDSQALHYMSLSLSSVSGARKGSWGCVWNPVISKQVTSLTLLV